MRAAKLPRLEYLFHFVEGQSLMPNRTRDVGIAIQTEAAALIFHREQESRGQLSQMRFPLGLVLLHRFHPCGLALCNMSRRRLAATAARSPRLRAGNCNERKIGGTSRNREHVWPHYVRVLGRTAFNAWLNLVTHCA